MCPSQSDIATVLVGTQLQQVVALIAIPGFIPSACPLQAQYALAGTFRLFQVAPRQNLETQPVRFTYLTKKRCFALEDKPDSILAASPNTSVIAASLEDHAFLTLMNPITRYLAIPTNCPFLSPNPQIRGAQQQSRQICLHWELCGPNS